MLRTLISFAIVFVAVAPLSAQTAAATAPQPFDRNLLRLKRERLQWQLWAGNLLLKDFGTSEADAREALQLFRDLRVNSCGSIGGIFEYFLTDGQAPTAPTRNKLVVPFNPESLRAEPVGDHWVLRDRATILYDFGSSQSDAQAALSICRQYGFNQLGVFGQPTPAMRYLFRSTSPLLAERRSGAVVQAAASHVQRPQLKLPGRPAFGEISPLDARRLTVRKENGDWIIGSPNAEWCAFGPREHDARVALQALQQFRVTDLCRVGPEFSFMLSNGHAPRGTLLGLPARSFRIESLTLRRAGGDWTLCEDRRPLWNFRENETEARNTLAAIRHYQFDSAIALPGGLYLMVRAR